MPKFFIYFPETDEEILRTDDKLISIFFDILHLVKGQNDIFYDSSNIDTYLQKINFLGLYLANPREQIKIKLSKLGAIPIKNNSLSQGNCTYILWNFDEIPQVKIAQNLISEIAERYFQYPSEKYLLLNLQNSIKACREKILVFKDAKYNQDLPTSFAKIDFVSDNSELEIWLNTNDHQKFSLLNKNIFKRTSLIQQGKPVFEELNTGNYWYLDNLHKNEYEVFNSNKEHIGVANMNGEVDYSKKVKGRTF